MLTLLIIVVVGIAIGVGVLSYRHRPEHSIESGISSFRREMSALAPPVEPQRRPQDDDQRTAGEPPRAGEHPDERRQDGPR